MPVEIHAFVERYLVPAQLVLAMLGMGATLQVRDFTGLARNPFGLALGLALQVAAVPAIAVAFTRVLDMPPGWSVGLLLVAVVPGGAFSNLFTYLARGNTPLSIGMTVVATLGCIITVPFVLDLTASALLPATFTFPVRRVVVDIFAFLLVPLVGGMLVHRVWPKRARLVSLWAIRVSLALIVVITISALGTGRIKVFEYGIVPPARILLFGVVIATLIPLACRVARRYDDDTVALGIEVVVRNIGVALLMIRFFFPDTEEGGHVLYTCLFYAGISGTLALPMLLLHRYGRSPIWFLPRRRRGQPG